MGVNLLYDLMKIFFEEHTLKAASEGVPLLGDWKTI